MNQTRVQSAIEAAANTAIGYGVALLSQLVLFPLFGIHVSVSTNLAIGAWFTAISLIRGYVLRRWFNARLRAAAAKVADRLS
jgi:hypothetical protein